MKFNFFANRKGQWVTLLAVAAAAIAGSIVSITVYNRLLSQLSAPSPPTETRTAVNAVAALGSLEPQGEVIRLSTPNKLEASRVDKLLVKRGDRVNAGQVVAILGSHDRLAAALIKAQQQVKVNTARLAKVKAGAKVGEIEAQKAKIENVRAEKRGQITTQEATIKRLEAELQGEKAAQAVTIERLTAEWRNGKTECDRYQQLYKEGAVTTSSRDSKCLVEKTAFERVNEAGVTLNRIVTTRNEQIAEAKAILKRTVDTLQEQLAEAKATLEQTAEVRPVDVAIAQAELEDAKAAVQQAEAELDLAYVRSPKAGRILKIQTRPGEIVSDKGIVEIGQTDRMYVTAEVSEMDISKVSVGQRVTITSAGFTGKLQGTVDEIGLEIGKKDALGTDPVADVDARVVEVKIRLDPAASQQVRGLTNLQVKAVIATSF